MVIRKKNLFSKPWWPTVKKAICDMYGKDCETVRPIPIEVKLPSGRRKIVIQNSWYDCLVLTRDYNGIFTDNVFGRPRVLDSKMKGIHCIEIKYSKSQEPESFGAFTIGEWITAYLSTLRRSYDYRILYVWLNQRDAVRHVFNISVNKQFLQDMLSFPNYKLYFYPAFIRKYIHSQDSDVGRQRERDPATMKIDSVMRSALYKLVEFRG